MKYDLTGKTFGELFVIERSGSDPKHKDALWLCRCSCGKLKIARSYELRIGKTSHCGCLLGKRISEGVYRHGCEPKRLHQIWSNMKTRCYNPRYALYHRYGGRGIRVCQEWVDDYGAFKKWALSHGYAGSLQIDRIDNDADYGPSNCKFSTETEQANNRSTNRIVSAFGFTGTLADTARRFNVKYSALQAQINRGNSPADAIFNLRGDAD